MIRLQKIFGELHVGDLIEYTGFLGDIGVGNHVSYKAQAEKEKLK